LKRLYRLAAFGCCLLPLVASALDEKVGRLTLTAGASPWRVVSSIEAPAALLDQGVSGSIPSTARILAFRPDGSTVDALVMVLRASTGSSGYHVSWTQACDSSANIVATRLTRNFSLPDCMKLSGNVVAEKAVSTALPPVAQASARGEVKLPARARYFEAIVGLETGSFASVVGLLDSKTPGIEEWLQGFAETLQRGNLSWSGATELPAPPQPAVVDGKP
jgi:hypothetical protein